MKRWGRVANGFRALSVAGPVALAVVLWGGLSPGGEGIAAQTGPGGEIGSGGQGGSHQASANGTASNGPPSLLDTAPSPFADSSRQKRNDERQRRMVIDTQKLVALTAQLKAEVAASGAEAMTPEMLKQMDEIEKLAKSVKDKMRD